MVLEVGGRRSEAGREKGEQGGRSQKWAWESTAAGAQAVGEGQSGMSERARGAFPPSHPPGSR